MTWKYVGTSRFNVCTMGIWPTKLWAIMGPWEDRWIWGHVGYKGNLQEYKLLLVVEVYLCACMFHRPMSSISGGVVRWLYPNIHCLSYIEVYSGSILGLYCRYNWYQTLWWDSSGSGDMYVFMTLICLTDQLDWYARYDWMRAIRVFLAFNGAMKNDGCLRLG